MSDVATYIIQMSYRFEAQTGVKPTEFYLGFDEAKLFRESVHDHLIAHKITHRDVEDCMPSEWSGMHPHIVMESSHLSFGIIVRP